MHDVSRAVRVIPQPTRTNRSILESSTCPYRCCSYLNAESRPCRINGSNNDYSNMDKMAHTKGRILQQSQPRHSFVHILSIEERLYENSYANNKRINIGSCVPRRATRSTPCGATGRSAVMMTIVPMAKSRSHASPDNATTLPECPIQQ